jgi:hypothetical protein
MNRISNARICHVVIIARDLQLFASQIFYPNREVQVHCTYALTATHLIIEQNNLSWYHSVQESARPTFDLEWFLTVKVSMVIKRLKTG